MPRKKINTVEPHKNHRSFGNTRDYKYLWGHSTSEVLVQLPKAPVLCWFNGEKLSVPECAKNKFLQEKDHCKRCSLFQEDEHAKTLRELIVEWERDEVVDK